jgi:hypothetical protein
MELSKNLLYASFTCWVAPAVSVGCPPVAELELLPEPVSGAELELLELPAAELELLEPPAVLLPLAEGEDLLEEQPAASNAATAKVVPVRTSDVRRDVTEDHAPEEYSRPLPPDIPSSSVRVHRHTRLTDRQRKVFGANVPPR